MKLAVPGNRVAFTVKGQKDHYALTSFELELEKGEAWKWSFDYDLQQSVPWSLRRTELMRGKLEEPERRDHIIWEFDAVEVGVRSPEEYFATHYGLPEASILATVRPPQSSINYLGVVLFAAAAAALVVLFRSKRAANT